MIRNKPSEELIDFFRKYREEEIKFLSENNLILKYDTIQDYIQDKIIEHIEILKCAGFTPIEIKQSFEGFNYLENE